MTKIQTVNIANLAPGAQSEEMVAKLKATLDGTTYMNLRVIAAPYMGNLVVSVQGEAVELVKEELNDMVLTQLAMAVMKG